VIFSTHVIAHAERLCDEVAIIAGGRVPFAGPVDARATASARKSALKRGPMMAHGARPCR
jgi:ABC-type uncharacterized transport system ATPase subunit